MTIFFNCSKNEFDVNDFNDDSSITTLNGTWKVISFEDFKSNELEIKTSENSWDYDIIISFNDSINPHKIYGRITTNSVNGEFEYVGERKFLIDRMGTTFVGEPEWGEKFRNAISDGAFKINSERLRIYYNNKRKSVTLLKESF